MTDPTAPSAGGFIAREGQTPIDAGTRVTLHFSIQLSNGDEVDTTRRGDPATFDFGDGNLLPGFEAALVGLKAGDDAQLPILAADAFGPHREDNIRRLRLTDFPNPAELEPGLMLSFASPEGELPGVVRTISGMEVEVDFNHPLAGRDIVFDVTILRVERL